MEKLYDIQVKVISQKGECGAEHKVGDSWIIGSSIEAILNWKVLQVGHLAFMNHIGLPEGIRLGRVMRSLRRLTWRFSLATPSTGINSTTWHT